jgi:hypothetical protein
MVNYELASEEGKLVTVETENGGERIAAHLFIMPGGFIFADMGWNEPLNSSHPLHYMEGEMISGGYIDPNGKQWDIYIEDKPAPNRGDRANCWNEVKLYSMQLNLKVPSC